MEMDNNSSPAVDSNNIVTSFAYVKPIIPQAEINE